MTHGKHSLTLLHGWRRKEEGIQKSVYVVEEEEDDVAEKKKGGERFPFRSRKREGKREGIGANSRRKKKKRWMMDGREGNDR